MHTLNVYCHPGDTIAHHMCTAEKKKKKKKKKKKAVLPFSHLMELHL